MDLNFSDKSDDKLVENIAKMYTLKNMYYGTPHDYLLPQLDAWLEMTNQELQNRKKKKLNQEVDNTVTVINLCSIDC